MQEKALSRDPADGGSELRIPATAVSRGIGIGRAVFLNGNGPVPTKHDISPDEVDGEIERLRRSVRHSLDEIIELSSAPSPDSAADIFGVHSLILESSSLIPDVETQIRSKLVNAEWAIRTVSQDYSTRQRAAADDHISDKYLDVVDVAGRLLNALAGSDSSHSGGSDSVLIVTELMPSRLMELAKTAPKAIISEHGGWTSHSSILARELKLPVVTGVRNIERLIADGDAVIVDGINGEVIVRPSETTLAQFSAITNVAVAQRDVFTGQDDKTVTKDGVEIVVRVNTDDPNIYQQAKEYGAMGVGLYRSEAIFDRTGSFPSEDEQFVAYTQIASATGEAGVRIRTFDVGVGQLGGDDRVIERNPSLGLRSIRLSLTDESYFRTQIRAILRASYGNTIDIVLPMISGVDEIFKLRAIIDEERVKLTAAGVSLGKPLLGAMIEVPSAVMTANEIAQNVDFLCLGTNDLVQYLLAVDRDNEAVADWYQTLHPAVIRSIREVVDAAKIADIPLNICGEIAGSPFYTPLLLGLGARELSMTVNSIQQIRRLISGITFSEAAQLVDSISPCVTAGEIEDRLRSYYLSNWNELFPPGILSVINL
ncbi:MAG: phosphoenolpyruvate--protein phosphotransferase [Pyrinomonadaceae bacterium]